MKIPSEIVLCLKKLYLLHGSEMLPDELYNIYWNSFGTMDVPNKENIEKYLLKMEYVKYYNDKNVCFNFLNYSFSQISFVSITEKVLML